jgi:hypothetical protein
MTEETKFKVITIIHIDIIIANERLDIKISGRNLNRTNGKRSKIKFIIIISSYWMKEKQRN